MCKEPRPPTGRRKSLEELEEPLNEPLVENIDPEAAQQELEDAGWVRMERSGKIVWQNPEIGHLYPQGAALSLVRRNRAEAADNPGGGGVG